MKRFLLASGLALAVLVAMRPVASAHKGEPFRIGITLGCVNYGFSFGYDARACGGCGGCGPCSGFAGPGACGGGCGGGGVGNLNAWYTYWPYEAHFQTPAPVGFPYWPTMSPYDADAASHAPAAPAYPGVSPVNYNGGVPAYWYGR